MDNGGFLLAVLSLQKQATHAIKHTMEGEEEIEVNFRLDGAGRTTTTALSSDAPAAAKMDYTTKACSTRLRVLPRRPNDAAEHASSPSASSSAIITSESPLYDELLLDCEIADSGLMPRTFWVPAEQATTTTTASNNNHTNSFSPRCTLEQMARDIFRHHTASVCYDPATSGAEWWVQLRPSPETTGRYAMHDPGHADNDERHGISFHWDKDEDLRLLCGGGTTYVHPHLSTVTYLTALGAPTLVAEGFRIHSLTGEWMPAPAAADWGNDDDNNEEEDSAGGGAFISWPRTGKHLSFDGRYLHAAPADLQEPGAFGEQCRVPPPPSKEGSTTTVGVHDGNNNAAEQRRKAAAVRQRRRHRRCTFLVNIWLNYKPFNVHPFPDTMIDKMSGYYHHCSQPASSSSSSPAETGNNGDGRLGQPQASSRSPRLSLSFQDPPPTVVGGEAADRDDSASNVTTVIVQSDLSVKTMGSRDGSTEDDPPPLPNNGSSTSSSIQQFTWPMGDDDSGESIQMTLPLSRIRAQATKPGGGNVRVRWQHTVGGQKKKKTGDDDDDDDDNDDNSSNTNFGIFLAREGGDDTGSSAGGGANKRPRLAANETAPTKSS